MIRNSISFAFFGSDDFSTVVLNELKSSGLLPALIVTHPDRPKGRGLRAAPPPVKLWAQENRIPFLQPEELDSFLNLKLSTFHFQLLVVASYGLIIPKHILDIPTHGMLNVHPSLLPKYRGATPIESQILNDEKEIGITIMLIDERMDHGPIVAQKALGMSVIPAAPTPHPSGAPLWQGSRGIQTPTATELKKLLAHEGGKLLAEIIPQWVTGEIKPAPQDESKATYTKKLSKADGEINFADSGYQNFLKIRAFDGGIGTYFYYSPASPFQGEVPSVRGGGVGAVETTPLSVQKQSPPLEQEWGEEKIRVKIADADFRDNTLRILRVVPKGRKEMSYEEFLRGLK